MLLSILCLPSPFGIPITCMLGQYVLISMWLNLNLFSLSLSLCAAFWVIIVYQSPVY